MSFDPKKKKNITASLGILAPENRIFFFLAVAFLVVVVLLSFLLYRWLTVEDPVSVNAGRVDASGLYAEADAQSTDAYKDAMAQKDKQQYEAAKNRANGAFMPFAFDEDPVEPSGFEGDSIGECQCQMSEERFKEMLRRVGGSGFGSERDAMKVAQSDIYLTTKLQLVDNKGLPLRFRGGTIFMDKSGALLDNNGVGIVSANNEALYLSKSGQFLDVSAQQLRLRGELVDTTGKVILGNGQYATRPGNMKRASLSDIYVTRDGQLVTLDGRGIRHSGAFVFRNDEKKLLNANGAEAAWSKQAVYQNNDGQLVNIAGKKFETNGILFSYDGILIDNDGRLTKPLVDIERIAQTDIFKDKRDNLVDGSGEPLLHYGKGVRLGQGNRIIVSGGGKALNRQGNSIYLSESSKFVTDVGGGSVQSGFLKTNAKLAFNNEGQRINQPGRMLRRGDSDIFTTSDGFLSDVEGRSVQFLGKDTFIDYDRELANGAQGLMTYDANIVLNRKGFEVFLAIDGTLVNRNGESINDVGLLTDSDGVLLNASGKKVASSGSLERVTTKDGKPVTLNGQEVFRGSDGALYDADGNPLLSDSGAAIFMDENGRIVDEFGREMDSVVLRAGDREVQNGELTTRKAVTTGSGESVFVDGRKVFTDATGRLIDENGEAILSNDGRELFLDRDGNIVDAAGNIIEDPILQTRSGQVVKTGLVAGREQVVTKAGGIVTYDGKAVFRGENGALVDVDGNAITDDEGNRLYIDSEGNIVDANGDKVEDSRLRVQGEQVVSATDIATKSVLTDKNGALLTYDGAPVYRGADGRLYDKFNNLIKTKDGRDVYVNEKGDLVDSNGQIIEEDLLKAVSREKLKRGSIMTREALLNKDGSPVTFGGKTVYVDEDGILYDANGDVIKDKNGSSLRVNEDGVVVDEEGAIAEVEGLSSNGIETRSLTKDETLNVKALLDESGKAMTYNGKKVYFDEQGRVVDEDGNLITDSQGRQVYYDEKSGAIVDKQGKAITENLLKNSNGVFANDKIKGGEKEILQMPGELKEAKKLLDKSGKSMSYKGKDVFVDEQGRVVDADGNLITDSSGRQVYYDQKTGALVDKQGKAIKENILQDSSGKYISDQIKAGPTQVISRNGGILTVGGKEAFIGKNGELVDENGKAILSKNGEKLYVDSNGNIVNADGKRVEVPDAKIATKSGLQKASEPIIRSLRAGELTQAQKLLDKSGKALSFNGKDVFVDEQGRVVDAEGKVVTDSQGRTVYFNKDTGELVDISGRKIEEKLLMDSSGKMLSDGIKAGKKQVVSKKGGVLTVGGKEAFVSDDGSLVDKNGKALLSADGKKIFVDDDGNLVDAAGNVIVNPTAQIESKSNILSQATTRDGGVVQFDGKSVFIDEDGFLVDENGVLIRSENGERIKMDGGNLVSESGKRVTDPRFDVAKTSSVNSGITLSKDQLVTKSGEEIKYKGQSVFRNKDGSLVTADGNAVVTSDGLRVFSRPDGTLVDENGNVIDEALLTSKSGAVASGDLTTAPVTDMKRVGGSDMFVAKDGSLLDDKGRAITFNGKRVRVNENGSLIDENGQLVRDKEGNVVFMNAKGQLVDKSGRRIEDSILADGEGVLLSSDGKSVLAEIKRVGNSDIYTTTDGRLVDKQGKAIKYNGKDVYRGEDGQLRYDNGQLVQDERGRSVFLNESGALVDKSGEAITGNVLTDRDGVLIDSKGEKLDGGGKLTRIAGTDYYRAENGQVVTADGKPAIIEGKEVYVDEQGRLVTPTGRPIRYKGKALFLGEGNRLMTEDGKGIEKDGRQLFLAENGMVDEEGNLAERRRSQTNNPPPPIVVPLPEPNPVKVAPPEKITADDSDQSDKVVKENTLISAPTENAPVPMDGAAAERLMRRYAVIKSAMRAEIAGVESFANMEPPSVDAVGYEYISNTEEEALSVIDTDNSTEISAKSGNSMVVARAGSALYAINSLKLNSDYSNRVVLDIVGRSPKDALYKAKAFGSFELKYNKLVLSINSIGTKEYGLIGVEAIAVDVKSAEVGVASDVDTHFWYRYGGLFAASILAGVSEAAAESGTREESITPTGTKVTTTGLEGAALAARALGRTGETFTEVLAGNINRPPTATLSPGEEMALILFDDLKIPIKK